MGLGLPGVHWGAQGRAPAGPGWFSEPRWLQAAPVPSSHSPAASFAPRTSTAAGGLRAWQASKPSARPVSPSQGTLQPGLRAHGARRERCPAPVARGEASPRETQGWGGRQRRIQTPRLPRRLPSPQGAAATSPYWWNWPGPGRAKNTAQSTQQGPAQPSTGRHGHVPAGAAAGVRQRVEAPACCATPVCKKGRALLESRPLLKEER